MTSNACLISITPSLLPSCSEFVCLCCFLLAPRPATFTAEYAGIHARTEEQWPDQYRYHYPEIFNGSAGPCKVRYYTVKPSDSSVPSRYRKNPDSSALARYRRNPDSSTPARYRKKLDSSAPARYRRNPDSSTPARYRRNPDSSAPAEYHRTTRQPLQGTVETPTRPPLQGTVENPAR